MAVENELTTEERAEFAEHGVTFNDPAATDQAPAGDLAPAAEAAPVVEAPAAAPAPAAVVIETARDPATGQFVTPPVAEVATPPIDPATGLPSVPVAGAPPPGFVPHAALHAERQRSADLARQMQVAQTRMNALITSRQTAPDPLPDPEVDPVAFLEALGDRVVSLQQQRQEETVQRQMDTSIETDENTFTAYTPDYPDASNHYVQSRAAELLINHTMDAAREIMTNEVRQIAQAAWQRGIPAAQMIYELAQTRGYKAGGAPATTRPLAAPAAPAAVALTPAAIVAAANAGQAHQRSLSGPGGGASKELDANALLAMSDEEFADYMKLDTKGANERFALVAGR